MVVDNVDIARLITRYADLLEVDGANPFRIRAYRSAVRLLAGFPHDMAKMVEAGRDLTELDGIGKILADKITTIVRTGDLPQLRSLEEHVPAGLADLMELSGLGAKRVGLLYHKLGVEDLQGLERVIEDGTIQQVSGFSGRTLERLRKALAEHYADGTRPAADH